MRAVRRSRVAPADLAALGTLGARTRPGRAALTALGIAVGVCALVSVHGVSASSRARLLADIDRLGTDILEVVPGHTVRGERATLPPEAPAMLARIAGVQGSAGVATVDATVRRTDLVPEHITGGISVLAADPDLLRATRTRLAAGRFLDAATGSVPAVVLGHLAAERLGIGGITDRPLVFIAGSWFAVVGVLEPNGLVPSLDRAALVGTDLARAAFDPDLRPSAVYVRTTPVRIDAVRALAAATANPTAPNEVNVLRPADALLARAAASGALNSLLVVLGAVTLLVGGIGVANVMIVAVLERRGEIGLRRALGATSGHVAVQFLAEAIFVGVAGGAGGAAAGAAVTAAYASTRSAPFGLRPPALAGAVVAAAVVAALAGIHPAVRAARLAPAEALRSP